MIALDEPITEISTLPKESEHRFLVEISEDEYGMFSALALNLPGTGSCGETEAEAIKNFKEAASGVLESYAESGDLIPWKLNIPTSAAKRIWLAVHG